MPRTLAAGPPNVGMIADRQTCVIKAELQMVCAPHRDVLSKLSPAKPVVLKWLAGTDTVPTCMPHMPDLTALGDSGGRADLCLCVCVSLATMQWCICIVCGAARQCQCSAAGEVTCVDVDEPHTMFEPHRVMLLSPPH